MGLEFKDINLSSRKLYEKYIKPWKCENAEFSFAHMYIWGCDGKIQFAEAEDCLFVKLDFSGEIPFFMAAFPKGCFGGLWEGCKSGMRIYEQHWRKVDVPFGGRAV